MLSFGFSYTRNNVIFRFGNHYGIPTSNRKTKEQQAYSEKKSLFVILFVVVVVGFVRFVSIHRYVVAVVSKHCATFN